ncbi:MAG: leucine-rich repeat domain-containing protein, partial [Clostridia bacterium]|nr:leucine-rich repeat domain-containing protein [Clostridia bacterium]
MKRILSLILLLSLLLSCCAVLSACGGADAVVCENHVDKNNDKECDECGAEMLTDNSGECQHKIRKVKEKAATCTENGNKKYYLCDLCGDRFSDIEGKNEITSSSVIIFPTGHTDADNNSVCDVCAQQIITDPDDPYNPAPPEGPTECAHTHMNTVNPKAPTCQAVGNIEYYICAADGCGQLLAYSFDRGHYEITLADTVLPIIDCVDMDTDGYCDMCNAPVYPGNEPGNPSNPGDPSNPSNPEVENPTGLRFELNGDGQSYKVSDIGSCTDRDIIIPSTYNGLPVTEIEEYAFSHNTQITSVVIPDSVTYIGAYSFYSVYNLKKVVLPNTIEFLEMGAFSCCQSLTEINIPTSLTELRESVFSYCGFETFTVPNHVTVLFDEAFAGCVNLVSIELPNTLTSIGEGVFAGCGNLLGIELPENITVIGSYTFADCYSLESIIIRGDITAIGEHAFEYCDGLKSIAFPMSLRNISDSAFYCCEGLENVYYLSGKREQFYENILIEAGNDSIFEADIHYAGGIVDQYYSASTDLEFELDVFGTYYIVTGSGRCYDIDVVIPKYYNGLPVSGIGESAFDYMRNQIQTLHISASVTFIHDYALNNCFNVRSITVDPSNIVYKSVDGNLYTKNGRILIYYAVASDNTHFDIPSGVAEIKDGAFSGAQNLESITVPEGVTSIYYGTFFDCGALRSISLPSTLLRIDEWAFNCCDSLESIIIPKGITFIGEYAFYECYKLTDVYYLGSESDFSRVSVLEEGNYYFVYADFHFTELFYYELNSDEESYTIVGFNEELGISEVVIPSTYRDLPVTAIGERAFEECDGILSVVIPDSVIFIDSCAFMDCHYLVSVTLGDGVETISNFAFADCNRLTTFIGGESLEYLGEQVFAWCGKLETVQLSDSLTYIGYGAFRSCSKLASIDLGDSIEYIGESAFYSCTSLTEISLGENLASIGDSAFDRCSLLTDVYYAGNIDSFGRISVGNGNEYLTDANIHCAKEPDCKHPSMAYHDAKQATCQETGNIEYQSCSCGKYFTMDGTEILLEDTVTPITDCKDEELNGECDICLSPCPVEVSRGLS